MQRSFLLLLALIFATADARADVWWLARGTLSPITPAGIIGPTDDRLSLMKGGSKLGFSVSEIARMKVLLGKVTCPGTSDSKASEASAIILTNEVVLTAGHVFVDREGRRRNPSRCYFQSAFDPTKQLFLGHTLKIGFEGVRKDRSNNDWALIKFARKLPQEFELLDVYDRRLLPGDRVFQLSAVQDSQPAWIPSGHPIISACETKAVFPQTAQASSIFYADCDVFSGASGGPTLIRADGKLFLAGIVQGSIGGKNFSAYSLEKGPASKHIAVFGHIWTAVHELKLANHAAYEAAGGHYLAGN